MSNAKQPEEQLGRIKKLLADFKASNEKDIKNLTESSEKLIKACNKVAESWSGSCAGYHGRLYYKGFVAPPMGSRFSVEWGGIHGIPDGWSEPNEEQVKQQIEKLAGDVSLDNLEKAGKVLQDEANTFRDEVVLNLSTYTFSGEQAKQKQLLEKIENQELGKKKEIFIKALMPSQIVSRDSEAVMQGMCTQAHMYYEGVALEGSFIFESVSELLKNTEKLIRHLEISPQTVSKKLSKEISKDDSPVLESHIKDITSKKLLAIFPRMSIGALVWLLGIIGFIFLTGYKVHKVVEFFKPKTENVELSQSSRVVADAQLLLDAIPKLQKGMSKLNTEREAVSTQIEELKEELHQDTTPAVQSSLENLEKLHKVSGDTTAVIGELTQNISSLSSEFGFTLSTGEFLPLDNSVSQSEVDVPQDENDGYTFLEDSQDSTKNKLL